VSRSKEVPVLPKEDIGGLNIPDLKRADRLIADMEVSSLICCGAIGYQR